jgi:hypothetical protein
MTRSAQDEHVQVLELDDDPDLPVIQFYITSAARAYELAATGSILPPYHSSPRMLERWNSKYAASRRPIPTACKR